MEKWSETYCLSNEEKEKWIEDYVERETAVTRKPVREADGAIMQPQDDMSTAEYAGATTRKPARLGQEILNAFGNSLSNLASSDNEQNGEDEEDKEEDTELSKLSDEDEPGWVMGTIVKTVQHCMEYFRQIQIQMRLDELTQPGCGDAANCTCEWVVKYGTAELKVPAVVKPQIDITTATLPQRTIGELIQTVEIVRWQSKMPAGTSHPGSSQMRLDLEKPQWPKLIPVFSPDDGGRFDADSGCDACWTHKLLTLHKASLLNNYIENGSGRRYGDGSQFTSGIDSQMVNLDDLSIVYTIYVTILLRVSFFMISVTKLWDMIFHQGVCKVVLAMRKF